MMSAGFTWNLLILIYLSCDQCQCDADVYHVGFLASSYADYENRFAAVPMALEQYLVDNSNNTLLSKSMFKWVFLSCTFYKK